MTDYKKRKMSKLAEQYKELREKLKEFNTMQDEVKYQMRKIMKEENMNTFTSEKHNVTLTTTSRINISKEKLLEIAPEAYTQASQIQTITSIKVK